MNIRIVRNKIKSVANVKKITRAMQLVSAVKMKKSQELALSGKPYQEILEKMINRVTKKANTSLSNLLSSHSDQSAKDLVILITSNKGLCGAFNSNLLRFLIASNDFKNADFVVVGKKGEQLIGRMKKNILADFSAPNFYESVSAIIGVGVDNFLTGKYKRVVIYYNKFVSSLRVEPTAEILLPVVPPTRSELEEEDDYLIEPAPELILNELLRIYIEEKLRYIFIQNEAGEHAARMIAMKNATDNANEIIYNLTLLRNKLRQQKITYELLDMITAKESVEAS